MIHRKKVQHSSYHVPKVFFLILKKICQINMTVQVLKKIDHFNKNYFIFKCSSENIIIS